MTTFNVYRRESNDINPPVAIATGLTSMSYSDDTAEENKTYLYSIGAVKSGFEKISSEITVSTVANDPHWASVTLLVDAESGIIKDWSSQNRSLTISNASVVNFSDAHSIYKKSFRLGSGVAKVQSITNSYLWILDFTAEILIKPTSIDNVNGTRLMSVGGYDGGSDGGGFMLVAFSDRIDLYLYKDGIVNAVTSSGFISINEYSHVALMRKNQIFYVFVNGVLVAQSSTSFNYYSIWKTDLFIGSDLNGYHTVNGDIIGFRLTQGVSRYPITGFIPPIKFPTT